MDASHEKEMFSLWSAICILSRQAVVFTFISHLSKNYLFSGLRYSLYLKPLSLKSISQNMAHGKKVAILDLSAGLFQRHTMLQSNCRYFHCCDLFNKTFLLHWSKECVYFLEHVEASFPSSTQSGILPPSCPPPSFPCSLLYVMKTSRSSPGEGRMSLAGHTVPLFFKKM